MIAITVATTFYLVNHHYLPSENYHLEHVVAAIFNVLEIARPPS